LVYQVPAGALSTKHGIRVRAAFTMAASNGGSGAAGTANIRVLFGGTAYGTYTLSATSSVTHTGTLEFFIANNASASAQNYDVQSMVFTSAGASVFNPANGTATHNTAAAVDVKVQTMTSWNGSTGGGSITINNVEITPVICTP
jgi:hypothetical protein